MASIIVETLYETPLTDEQHAAFAKRIDPCLDAHSARWMRSYLSTDRMRLVCEFEAVDAEAVRASFRSAGVTFARAWTAEVYARKTDGV